MVVPPLILGTEPGPILRAGPDAGRSVGAPLPFDGSARALAELVVMKPTLRRGTYERTDGA